MSYVEIRAQRKARKSHVTARTLTGTGQLQKSSENTKVEDHALSEVKLVHPHGLYKALAATLEIKTDPATGRGIWAKSAHRKGSVMISLKPEITVLSTQYLDSHCSACCKEASAAGLKRCTQCRVLWYCDNDCQTRDWALHKRECRALQKWADAAPSPEVAVPSEAIRGLGRILWMSHKLGNESTWSREINAMQSHRESLLSSSFELHTHLAHSLVRYLGLQSPSDLEQFGFARAADVVDLTSRFVANTFTLTSPSLTPLGITVSPLIALINHSCDPNAVIVFPRWPYVDPKKEPQMQVIALKDIESDGEVLTAYIDTTLPLSHRRQSLEETYNFVCKCSLCVSKPIPDPRESMWCSKDCGGVSPLPSEDNPLTRCVKCNAVVTFTDEISDGLRVGQEALDKATALQFRDPAYGKKLTSNLILILSKLGLTPSCHPLLALSRLHQSLLVASISVDTVQDDLDDTIRTAGRSLAGLTAIFHPGHPVRCVATAELAKLLAVDEPNPSSRPAASSAFPPSGPQRLKLAYETAIKARNELLIGFGVCNEGGQVGREVREIIVAIETELGIWGQGVRQAIEEMPKIKPILIYE